ncbi:cadmium resistance transporter [Dolichospermum circinale]|uniref:Cadmium resistance transporter n=1 Tax=Dolichospermum circinale CS-537/01 TaxID=3021739 RepID=A0ABT5A696_9CYAN|nr:cadmium resistance transporter [Dolichospermum circinale]MDB9458159.1 cadmium resistance transporter [Dolichospermum circinale CS-545/17]MDB9487208.1 cadmium resistance transporter [Dolichospermum circinale CS-537/01]
MNKLANVFIEGIIAFTVTNIDDMMILLLLFSQIDSSFRKRHIFIGQYLGFFAIIMLSLPGFFGGLFIQREWLGLLGIIPIVLGMKQLINQQTESTESTEVQTVNPDFPRLLHPNPTWSFFLSIFHPNTYQVAAITIANSGDNISVYIPLFAGQNFVSLAIIIAVFLAMVGVGCGIAYLLTSQVTIGYILSRYGRVMIPFILMALGLFIMYDRGTFKLLTQIAI